MSGQSPWARGHRTALAAACLGVAVLLVWWFVAGRRGASEADARVVEIHFMGPGGPIAGAFDDVVRAFERHSREENRRDPSKPVYRVISGQDAAYDVTGDPTRFLISVAGGDPPDVVKFDRFAVAEWAARNAFEPLDKYIERDLATSAPDALQPEEFYANVWNEAKYKGRIYAIPTDTDVRVLYYNKDLLRRAGLVDPATGEAKPPRTWEEMREYARKLTTRDEFGRIQTVGFAPNYGNSWLYMFGWMAGATFMSADGTKVLLNEPGVVRALSYMHDIYADAGGYANVMSFQAGFQGGFLDPFMRGQVAMKIDGSGWLATLSQYGRTLDCGTAPAPLPADRVVAGAPPVTWSGGFSFAIPHNAHRKEAAWEFIRFAASDRGFRLMCEGEREFAEAAGFPYVPNQLPKQRLNLEIQTKYIFDNPRMPASIREGVRLNLGLVPHAKFRPVTPVAQILWTQQVSAMEEGLYGRKSPKAALDYANGIVQRDLDRYLAPRTGVPVNWRLLVACYLALLVCSATAFYKWDTNVAFRGRVLRALGRKREVGTGDMVEGTRGGYFRAQWGAGFLFTLPWITGFVIFGAGPLLFSVLMSFCDYDVLSPPLFTGLDNYRTLFFRDELAPKAFLNTAFMLLRIPIAMTLGLLLAMLLNRAMRGMTLFRTLCYLPAVMPAVAGFLLWIWVFNPTNGPLNGILRQFGIQGPNWLLDANWSKPSLMIMGLWGVGGSMVIWLAGLQSIPSDLYEAAALDGAGAWHRFRHVTLPMLSPYIFFLAIMGLIDGFKIFDEAFIMTHGGPVNSTLFYVYHLFNNAFRFGHMGYASALAWALFLVIVVFTALQMRLARKWVHYEGD